MGKFLGIVALLFGLVMTIYWFYLKQYVLGSIFIVADIVVLVILFIPMKGGEDSIEQYVEA